VNLRIAGSRWAWAVVMVAAIIPYLNSLDGGFHFDDEHALVRNTHLRHLSSIPGYFVDSATFSAEPDMAMYRPLLQTTFALNHALTGYDATSWHVVNVLLHALAALGAYALFRGLVAATPALFAALLFALHPAHSQAVNYLSSRSESMCMALVLWALVLFRSRQGAWSALVYAAALMTKSAAVALLPAALLMQWLRPIDRHRWRPLLPHGVVTAAYLGLINAEGFLPRSLAQDVRPLATQIWTQVKALLYYLQLAVIPRGGSVEHDFSLATSLREAPVLLAALALVSLLWLTLGALSGGRRAVGLGSLWFIAALGVPLFIPLNVLINEHRLYLPLAGFSLALATSMVAWRSVPRFAPVLLCLFYGISSWTHNTLWESELSLWASAVDRAPNSSRAWSNLGLALQDEGDRASATRAYRKALVLNPGHARAWNNLGVLLEGSADFHGARSAYEQAARRSPNFSGPLANLGRLALAAGDLPGAGGYLSQALSRNPRDLQALLHHGRLLQVHGQHDSAKAYFERVLELDPVSAAAANNLGMLLAENGQSAAAQQWLQQALLWAPDHAEAATNLMLLEQEVEGIPRREAYRRVLDRFPQQVDVALALGNLHAKEGEWEQALAVYQAAKQRQLHAVGLQAGLADAYQQLGQTDMALQAFREAVLQTPRDVRVWNGLAAAAAAEGLLDEARAATEWVLELDPENAHARSNLTRLREPAGDP
jgi:protein O-mannosyl-transferase